MLLLACSSPRPESRVRVPETKVSKPVLPEIVLQTDHYTLADSLHLFLKFEDVNHVLDVQQSSMQLQYEIRAGKATTDALLLQDSLQVDTAELNPANAGSLYLSLVLPARFVTEPNVLHLRLRQKLMGQERLSTFYKMPLLPKMLQKDYLLVQAKSGRPLFRNYTTTSDKLLMRQYGEAGPVIFHRYDATFPPALPPMSVRQQPVPQTINVVDTLSYTSADTIQFREPGLYLMQPDATYPEGLLVEEGSFPMITKSQEMLQPLIYLTTSTERETLFKSSDPKAAVDGFWLKVAGKESIARELIRQYYERVEFANKLYTSHKAGWATDRGMIYIVFGRPSQIARAGNTETWIYRESELSPYIKFVFNKKQNTFTENHYELERHREYEESWYSTVAQWRAGITEI